MQAILQERQQLAAAQQGQAHSPRRDQRPGTAGTAARPKATLQMLNETERMLLKAPNRHKSMLSAGARPRARRRPAAPPARPVLLPAGTGLIFPTEQAAPSSGRPTDGRRPRPCSAAPNPTSPGAASSVRRPHVRSKRPKPPRRVGVLRPSCRARTRAAPRRRPASRRAATRRACAGGALADAPGRMGCGGCPGGAQAQSAAAAR